MNKINEELMIAYVKYNKEISREIKFTLFDKNFLVEVYNENKELERQISSLREHIKELDERISKLEGVD